MAASPPKSLAQVSPLAATWTDLYTPSAGASGLVTVFICNSTGVPIRVRLAAVAAAGNAPANTDFLLYDEGARQIGPLALMNPQTLRCWAAAIGVSFIVMGYEE